MGKSDQRELLKSLDAAIKAGQAQAAIKELAKTRLSQIPDDLRLDYARLFRRCGLWEEGLSLVSKRMQENPSAGEIAEYGILLLRAGATDEAALILNRADASVAPEALQYRALVEMTRWEFDRAIPLLEQFIAKENSSYSALVAKVNLASCYVESHAFELAKSLLGEVLQETSTQKLFRLHCTSLAFRAQMHLYQKDYAAAQSDIEAGKALVENAATTDHLLFRKWSLILESIETKSVKPLIELRHLATAAKAWEDLRLADLFELRVKYTHEKFLHLIFGTPYEGFRKLLSREMGALPDRDTFYLGEKSAPRFDVRTGKMDDREILPAGGKIHQLFEILLRDFYQPRRIGALFTELFPGEYFNIETSPKRTHAVLVRARKWLRKEAIPVTIDETEGFFSFRIHGHFSFRIPLIRKTASVLDIYLDQAAQASLPKAFSASQLKDKLQVSRHTVQRIVQHGLETKRLIRDGEGPRTKYSFPR